MQNIDSEILQKNILGITKNLQQVLNYMENFRIEMDMMKSKMISLEVMYNIFSWKSYVIYVIQGLKIAPLPLFTAKMKF